MFSLFSMSLLNVFFTLYEFGFDRKGQAIKIFMTIDYFIIIFNLININYLFMMSPIQPRFSHRFNQ